MPAFKLCGEEFHFAVCSLPFQPILEATKSSRRSFHQMNCQASSKLGTENIVGIQICCILLFKERRWLPAVLVSNGIPVPLVRVALNDSRMLLKESSRVLISS